MKWISVLQGSPPYDIPLLVTANGVVCVATCYEGEYTMWVCNDDIIHQVTHWMPLPEVPK